jgi:hypothetical protein
MVSIALTAGCGGHQVASYPPTRGYSTAQVKRVFREHGIRLSHAQPLLNLGRGRLSDVLRTAHPGFVIVFIYKSSKEARLAAALSTQKIKPLQKDYPNIVAGNVVASVIAVFGGQLALKETRAAMAELRTLKTH